MSETRRKPDQKPRTRPDVAGLITGTVVAGGATIWLLADQDVIATSDLGLSVALLLVVSGILGLAASGRS
jgi:hypothetical protein